MIVLENHAFETNFTGLNNNDYTSKSCLRPGALLTHYYGTGHSSLDNYLSMISGQAPLDRHPERLLPATRAMSGTVDTTGTLDDER